ncbi:hypothetical protein PAPYR_2710 [Paratrimastix pyriformis]|uniref:Uncharacterized protein n=1 Tax=Paratrimastix pyriformis TaxID=342808 RepID=A0ABQ8UVU5_9EUKA|nr:hypothetical protein PAPYR_2710 [Paratrimastix pyriformis]
MNELSEFVDRKLQFGPSQPLHTQAIQAPAPTPSGAVAEVMVPRRRRDVRREKKPPPPPAKPLGSPQTSLQFSRTHLIKPVPIKATPAEYPPPPPATPTSTAPPLTAPTSANPLQPAAMPPAGQVSVQKSSSTPILPTPSPPLVVLPLPGPPPTEVIARMAAEVGIQTSVVYPIDFMNTSGKLPEISIGRAARFFPEWHGLRGTSSTQGSPLKEERASVVSEAVLLDSK